jgi:hypothetical protein
VSKVALPDEKPGRVWPFFVAIAIIIIAIIGIAAYREHVRETEREANQYKGFDFTQVEGGLWVTRIQVGSQPYDIPFYFHPRDTLTVLIDPTVTEPLANNPKEVIISIDPDANPKVVIAGVEIARITGSKYDLLNFDTSSALSRPAKGNIDIPVIDCRNATTDRVVLQFIEGSKNLLVRSDKYPNCVILQYTDANESIRVADRYAYMLLQIMH